MRKLCLCNFDIYGPNQHKTVPMTKQHPAHTEQHAHNIYNNLSQQHPPKNKSCACAQCCRDHPPHSHRQAGQPLETPARQAGGRQGVAAVVVEGQGAKPLSSTVGLAQRKVQQPLSKSSKLCRLQMHRPEASHFRCTYVAVMGLCVYVYGTVVQITCWNNVICAACKPQNNTSHRASCGQQNTTSLADR